MAYKFQLGAFTASGSIKAEDGFDADGQEASNFATISNGGSEITIAENAQVLGNVRISGSNALEFSDNNHAIKNQTGTNLEFVVGGQTRLEVQSSQIDAKLKIRMSGAQPIEFGSNNNRISKADGVENLEFSANNTKVLELQSTQVDVYRNLSVAAGQEIRISGSNNLKIHAPDGNTLSVEAGSGKAVRVERSGGGFVKVDDQVELSGSNARLFTNNDGITIEGGLQVDGTLTYVNTTNLQVTDANIVLGQGGSGSIDNIGLTFGSEGDNQTLLTKDSSTTQKLGSSLPLSASTYYGDGSNLTGISADNASSLRLGGAGAVVNSNVTISNDVVLVDSSADRTLTMPDITTSTVGRMYIIKDITGDAGDNPIIIEDSAAGHPLDGEVSISIESEFGAVNLMACSGTTGFFYSIF